MYNSSVSAGEAVLACQDFDYENHERRTTTCSEPLAKRDAPLGARGPLGCGHPSLSSEIPDPARAPLLRTSVRMGSKCRPGAPVEGVFTLNCALNFMVPQAEVRWRSPAVLGNKTVRTNLCIAYLLLSSSSPLPSTPPGATW